MVFGLNTGGCSCRYESLFADTVVRYVALALAFSAVMYADDITIGLDDGSIVVENPKFIRNGFWPERCWTDIHSYESYFQRLDEYRPLV